MKTLIFYNKDHGFESDADYETIKSWLKENKFAHYSPFAMKSTLYIFTKRSYMATKLAWI